MIRLTLPATLALTILTLVGMTSADLLSALASWPLSTGAAQAAPARTSTADGSHERFEPTQKPKRQNARKKTTKPAAYRKANAKPVATVTPSAVELRTKRKPTLLPAAQRRTRSSTPPPLTREGPAAPRRAERRVVPAPLPPAFDPPGDRGPPLGTPPHLDPRYQPATPPIGTPPLPPARQVPGESGIPLGPGPLSPVR